ncbi:MAG: Lrp/AsnC ligand binding domain-containing protein [Candidatus Bathyarchaeia archaeon]
MVNACVLVRVIPGRLEDVANALKGVANVRKSFVTFGRYDAVVFIEAPDVKTAADTALEVNALAGVKSTETALEL